MKKIGILTFHYSNNYGGVLQSVALHNTVKKLGYDVEIINYVPNNYTPNSIIKNLGIKKNILRNYELFSNIQDTIKKVKIMREHSDNILKEFNIFRSHKVNLSKQVDQGSIESILNNYSTIIVGSDQVWNPSQRNSPIYFLRFGDKYKGKKISYAADSTIREINEGELEILKKSLSDFDDISVRNDHSFDFVKSVIEKDVEIVADPTLLIDFDETIDTKHKEYGEGEYILTYVLGKEIQGSHESVINRIKNKYGNLPVYSIKIPTMNFELSPYADKVFYDLNPDEWINMFRNAKFIYTDSFHGVLFSLKYHKPFLAYYTEKLRASRFIDLAKRYNIDRYIIQNIEEMEDKKSLEKLPEFLRIDETIKLQKESSLKFLEKALGK